MDVNTNRGNKSMDPYNSAESFGAPNAAARPVPAVAQTSNPYAPPGAAVHDVVDEGEVVLASRLARLGAVLLDSMIVVIPAILAAIALPAYSDYVARAQGQAAGSSMPGWFAPVMGVLAVAFIAFAILQLVLLYRHGQTVGKKIVGIKIVRPDGSRASFPRLLGLRYVVPGVIGAIPFLGVLFSLIDPLFIFAEDRRCLHDKFADTIVVNA